MPFSDPSRGGNDGVMTVHECRWSPAVNSSPWYGPRLTIARSSGPRISPSSGANPRRESGRRHDAHDTPTTQIERLTCVHEEAACVPMIVQSSKRAPVLQRVVQHVRYKRNEQRANRSAPCHVDTNVHGGCCVAFCAGRLARKMNNLNSIHCCSMLRLSPMSAFHGTTQPNLLAATAQHLSAL